ncbi:thioredoxin domain-containing protein 3 isoform X1 [Erinaceus europaeus]|uniref:Thioredoxin domain-containing protein 3 isoform X1 n=1 Tax=Erinaceus europaeus TaxID=9365 RepID=A0ABM3XSN3_ERIEU|nr:thioredoxin domain-containing protein 3 isoform X1 [Erinaceus europaeus]
MAGKKREIQLQTVINSQTLWEEMLQNKGLTVIDVYQAWCGPCKAMQTLFRKLKNELNEDEILHFVVAEVDNIVALQAFKDKCEPVFLFSLNGKIVAKVTGANAPLVNKNIITLISDERKIIAGEMIRPQYQEVLLADSDSEDAGELIYDSVEQYSIAIIKPDVVITGKVIELKEKIISAGFVIEAETGTIFTEEEVRDVYSDIADQPDFEDFVSFMTSGLSYIVVISQGDEEEAENPNLDEYGEIFENESEVEVKRASIESKAKRDSLQEYLERQHISQFCDVEGNVEKVNRLIDIFFPDFRNKKELKLEKILVLLRPDILQHRKEDVLKVIQNEGFKILMERQLVLSEVEARTLCKRFEDEDYYGTLIGNMTRGPSLALVLLRSQGLKHWKELVGPISVEEAQEGFSDWLCAKFAMDSLPICQLHGSDSLEAAEREIQLLFPPQNTLAMIKPHVTPKEREEILKLIKENGFEMIQAKYMIMNEESAEKIYSKIKGRDFYKSLLDMLAEGPSLVMMLRKWNAILDWRRLMGPVDPIEAKLLSPDSIRAVYGRSILKNIVHGSSSLMEAQDTISKIFNEFVTEHPEEN